MVFPVDWDWNLEITTDSSQVSSDESGFPYYFDLSNITDSDFWNNIQSDGGDLRVSSDSDGSNQLPLEVVSIDTVNQTGEVHFKDDVVSGSDSSYYLWWRDSGSSESQPAVTDTYGRNNVWSEYDAVWHFNNQVSNGLVDSTGNGNTESSINGDPTKVSSLLGSGWKFDGNDSIDMPNGIFSGSDPVYSYALIKNDGSVDRSDIFDWRDNTQLITSLGYNNDNELSGWYSGWVNTGEVLNTNDYYDTTLRFDSSLSNSFKIYLNGTQVASDNLSSGSKDDFNSIAYDANVNGYYGHAIIDELRVANKGFSDGWITTRYNIISNNSGFWSVGSTTQDPNTSEFDTSHWKYRTPITTDNTLVDSDESGFPYYFDLSNITASDFWDNVDGDGGDLRVTTDQAGDNQVPLEVVSVDIGGQSGEVHFRDGTDSSADKTYYLWWKDSVNGSTSQPSVDSGFGRNSVWSEYKAVWHMETTSIIDSTGNGNDASSTNSLSTGTGKLSGNAIDFDGSSSTVDFVSRVFDPSQDHTISLWGELDSLDNEMLIGNDDDNSNNMYFYSRATGTDGNRLNYGGSSNDFNQQFTSGSYGKAVIRFDTSQADEGEYLFNNSSIGTFNQDSVSTDSTNLFIGYWPGNNGLYTDGRLDEIRISTNVLSDGWLGTSYNLENNNTGFWSVGTIETTNTGFNSNNWKWQLDITTDNTKVSSNETQFPYYFDLSNITDTNFWDNVQSDGGDIRISRDSDGNDALPLEVVSIDTTNETGEIHFKDETDSSADKTYYIWWKDTGSSETQPSNTDDYGRNNVWSEYKAVYHLDESSGSTAVDSTGNYDGTYQGDSPTKVSGEVGSGQDFDGSGDGITFPNMGFSGDTSVTVSEWINPDSNSERQVTFIFGNTGSSNQVYGKQIRSASNVRLFFWDNDLTTSSDPLSAGTWSHLVTRYDSGNNRRSIWTNGGETLSDNPSDPNFQNQDYEYAIDGGGRQGALDAQTDELRISGNPFSDGWVQTQYNIQSDNSTFWTSGTATNTSSINVTYTVSSYSDSIQSVVNYKVSIRHSSYTGSFQSVVDSQLGKRISSYMNINESVNKLTNFKFTNTSFSDSISSVDSRSIDYKRGSYSNSFISEDSRDGLEILTSYTGSFESSISVSKSSTLFQGDLIDIKKNDDNLWDLEVRGYGQRLNNIRHTSVYENTAPEEILKSAIEDETELSVIVEDSGFTIDYYLADNFLSKVADDMKKLLDWQIRADNNKNIYFEPKGASEGPSFVEGENCKVEDWNRNRDEMVNEVEVVGSERVYDNEEVFSGDGSTKEFSLTNKPTENIRVLVDGSEKQGGIGRTIESGDDYYVDQEGKKIVFDTAPSSGTDNVEIRYGYTVPVWVKQRDEESIQKYGKKSKRIRRDFLETWDDAREYAKKYISIYGTPHETGEVKVPFDTEADEGDLVSLESSVKDISGEFVVNKKETNFPEGESILEISERTFNVFDWQAETQKRIKELEEQLRDREKILIYNTFNPEVNLELDMSLDVYKRKINDSFILGHPDNGVLGTNKLGDRRDSKTLIREE